MRPGGPSSWGGSSRARYDARQLARHRPPQDQEAGPSRRTFKYGKAFQNWRRAIKYKLDEAIKAKRKRAAASAADASAADAVADSAVAEIVPGDPIWTTEDMEDFLDTVVTHEAQVAHHRNIAKEREDPGHKDFGKPMSMTIRPSDVLLFRVVLSSAHYEVVQAYFGNDSLCEAAERVKSQTEAQVTKFFEIWDKKLALITRSLDERVSNDDNGEAQVQKMLESPGVPLWDYMLTKTEFLGGRPRGVGAEYRQEIQECFEKCWQEPVYPKRPVAASAACLRRTAEETKADVHGSKDLLASDPDLRARLVASHRRRNTVRLHAFARDWIREWHEGAVCSDIDVLLRIQNQIVKNDKKITKFLHWQEDEVIKPCIAWLQENMSEFAPSSITLFGSHSYEFPLPSSDFDVAVVLDAGRNIPEFLKTLLARSKNSPEFTQTKLGVQKTYQPKFRGVPVDIKPVKPSRASDSACQSSDLVKFLLDSADGNVAADRVLAVRAFKMICHALRITQWHQKEPRGVKFKTISIVFWAWAILEQTPGPDDSLDEERYVGILLSTLVRAFIGFDWENWEVNVTSVGASVGKKKPDDPLLSDVLIRYGMDMDSEMSNSSPNVTLEFVRESAEKMGHDDIGILLEKAFAEQQRQMTSKEYEVSQAASRVVAASAAPAAAVSAAPPQPATAKAEEKLLPTVPKAPPPAISDVPTPPLPIPQAMVAASAAPPPPPPPAAAPLIGELHECKVRIGFYVWHLRPPKDKLTEDQKNRAPVMVLLSGAGGFGPGGPPRPLSSVWYFYADIPGKHKAPLTSSVPDALRALRQATNNKIVLCGFSRGARWVDEVLQKHADAGFDFAIAIAPYPANRDDWLQRQSAREVMKVNRPIMYVLFASDEFCNAVTYATWFQQFELGMQNAPDPEGEGTRRETFGFFCVAGHHGDAEKLFETFDFESLGDQLLTQFWDAAVTALGVGCHVFRGLS